MTLCGRMAVDGGTFDGQLAAARAGDPSAWSWLYHDVAPIVIGYLRAQQLPDPEDVAGEVFLEVVRGIDRFSGDHGGFRSWVLAIAHHRLLDARRRQQRHPDIPTDRERLSPRPAPDDPEAETIAAMGFGDLEPLLHQLTEDQRTVLLLRVIGDLSVAEVARIVGRRPGAVKQLQHRAVTTLRRALDARRAADPVAHRPVPVAGAERTVGDAGSAAGASSPGWST